MTEKTNENKTSSNAIEDLKDLKDEDEEEEEEQEEEEEERVHQESTFVIFQFVNAGESISETNTLIRKRTTMDSSVKMYKENVEVDLLDKIRNVCPFCDKQFSNEQNVERHVMVVHQKQYKCDMCKRSYNTQTALDVHKVIHRPDYFFECMECHVKYKSEGGLKRHNIRAHDRNNPVFVCEQCGRSYKLKIDLTNHIKKAHPFELQICRYCGKEVRDVKGHEYIHQRKAHKKLYNFPCHLCPQKFCHRSRLDRHLLQHENGFKCTDCSESFIGSRELKSHKRFKHSRPSSSTCIFCQKVFTCVSNFHQHVLTHAGIRPYKCDICEEDFTQRSSLLRHRRNHPGPLPPLVLPSPQIAELARSYMQKFQNGQIDKTSH
ncbi:zinc finger protein 675-like [Polistes fuscatus]|uniref:zinc finger protein 675-like n=1 Tax=Polistes fuscatus TaxID=30207 RepID=UPI001CA8A8D7|nr:zinc finger protein 675-like [Polistes fuscatus]